MSLTASEISRYSRHLSLREIGSAGQEKLKAARVLVIGAGGLGSPAALYLAASGVGRLGLIDHDRIDLSNLQRQVLYDSISVGKAKAEFARERLLALNPDIEVVAHAVELRAANAREIFDDYDIVVDGTDRFATRYLANDACVLLRKCLVSAAIYRFEGQAFTYVPDEGPCYRCLFADAPAAELVPNCAAAGVLGVLPGVLGAVQATEVIKLIIGAGEPLIGRLLTYDALQMRFGELRFARRPDCEVCGLQPSITDLRDAPDVCAIDDVRKLTARELHELMNRQNLVLIDVREPHEYGTAHLPGAISIPLSQLEARIAEIPADSTIIFMCRGGTRSLAACAIATRAGLQHPAHLEGGLLAWAANVDATFLVADL